MTRARRRLTIVLTVLALVAVACSGSDDGAQDATGEAGGGPAVSGEATLLSAYTQQQELVGVDNLIAAFNERYPDAEIAHEGSPRFEEQALARVDSGDPPEMMMILQPGLLKTFHDGGDLFWKEGTAWAAGDQQLDRTLQAIDDAWPDGACGVGGVGPDC